MMLSRASMVASAAACATLLSGCGQPTPAPTVTALLVIDVQDCFLAPDGSLGVPAVQIIEPINGLINNTDCPIDEVIYTQDYHPSNHISFASTHGLAPFAGFPAGLPMLCIKPSSGKTEDAACCPTIYIDPAAVNCTTQLCPPDTWNYDNDNPGIITGNAACTQCASNPENCYAYEQSMWTDHCLQTGDSGFPSSLQMGASPKIVQKGLNLYVDAYSGFKDNSKQVETELHAELQLKSITNLVVVGIATDVCVKESVIDAIDYGYTVTVLSDATAAVAGDQVNFEAAITEMRNAGATITTVDEWSQSSCMMSAGQATSAEKTQSAVFF